ncbi:hypothetical protein XENOCAPTIV_012339 [Xenoophorus captivus]|uniref:Uncharacterized protein n=1 Tax=Xenoophorus captivus TaxID=1517983 RepID=A0ABV0S6K3_9TELE
MRRSLPLTFCFHTGLSQYVALEDAEGRKKGESFYPCPVCTLPVCLFFRIKCINQAVNQFSVFLQDQTAQDPSAIDMFITGSSFLDWFSTYVNNVVTGEYPIIKDQIFR